MYISTFWNVYLNNTKMHISATSNRRFEYLKTSYLLTLTLLFGELKGALKLYKRSFKMKYNIIFDEFRGYL